MKSLKIILFSAFFVVFSGTSYASVWQREAPDTSGLFTGYFCSLALDSKDNPHIAYYDWDFKDLYYASFSDGKWIVEIVDSIGDAGMECSLIMDAQDRPHISYRQEYLGYYWKLKYATKTDNGWEKVIVDTPVDSTYYVSGYNSSIAIDSHGHPAISYIRHYPDEIRYAYMDENGWHSFRVTEIFNPTFTKLKFDTNNQPVIGYSYTEEQQGKLSIAYFHTDGSNLTLASVPENRESSLIGFDLDKENKAYFSYIKKYDSLQLAVYDGSSWDIETVTNNPGNYSSPGITLTVDRNNQPYIVDFYYSEELRLYNKENGQWKYQIVNNYKIHTGPTWDGSLAFDSDNHPHIAIHGSLSNRSGLFYYKYWPGDAHISIPVISHNYGSVWTQSYADWNCTFENIGDAPLIIDDSEFLSSWMERYYRIANNPLPFTILPGEKDSMIIRFEPTVENDCVDTLLIYTNDSVYSKIKIALQGRGTSSGSSGDVQIKVENIYIDHDHQLLKHDIPLVNASVELYQNSHLAYGPVSTNSAGIASLNDLDTGKYELKIVKQINIPGDEPGTTILDNAGITRDIVIGPGTNTLTYQFPDSLLTEKYQDIYNLTHITKYRGDESYTFYYPVEEDVLSLLNSWKGEMPTESEFALSRLILAENLTYRIFEGGYSMGNEFLTDIGELINLVYYSDSWGTSIWKIAIDLIDAIVTHDVQPFLKDMLIEVLKEVMQSMIMNLVTDGIHQITAELGMPGETIFNAAWELVKSNYSAWSIGYFSETNWEKTIKEVYTELKNPVFQEVYINLLTDEKIEKAMNYSRDFQYGGEFRDAYNNSNVFIAGKLEDIENTEGNCSDLRSIADLYMATGSIFSILDEVISFIPGLEFITLIRTAMKISAYGSVVTAMGISGYTFFTLPGDLDNAIEDIYLRDKPKSAFIKKPDVPFQRSRAVPHVMNMLKENLEENTSAYDSILFSIKNMINSGDAVHAALALEDLNQVEQNLRSSFNTALAPVFSVASLARDSVGNFQAEYDSLRSFYAHAGDERMINYIYIVFAPTDSSQAMKDTLSAQIDRTSAMNHKVKDQILSTLNTISDMEIPAIVVVNLSKQDKTGLESGETGTLQIQVQNTGSLPAENVRILIKNNPAIQVAGTDSVYVGELLPGAKSAVYTWTLSALSSEYTRGTWTAEIHSSNAKTYSTDGSFKIRNETSGIKDQDNHFNTDSYSRPNPFHPGSGPTTIHYRLKTASVVTLKIYDTSGKMVRILINKIPKSGNTEHEIRWNGKNSKGMFVPAGMYLYVIETGGQEVLTGRVIVSD